MSHAKIPTSINDLLISFAKHLQSETMKWHLEKIADLQAGFEGWIKMEFVLWAIQEYKLNPLNWEDKHQNGIGVEEVSLLCDVPKRSKCFDAWMHVGDVGTHYFEFKTLVAGYNESKQVGSWIGDFSCLCNIASEQYPVGAASILFVSSQPENKLSFSNWQQTINNWIKSSISPGLKCICYEVTNRVTAAALIHQYK